ncbi:MAG: hypothetical protein GX620_16610 [Chloroflexi bacterium]|nr:hypothetical protein [Chloroflexota bacterium]
MVNSGVVWKRAHRLLMALTLLSVLSLSTFAPLVSADETYSASDIETWLVDAISGSVVTVTAPPAVALNSSTHVMALTGFSFTVRGITVGLNELRLTFDGSNTAKASAELDVFGHNPRVKCDLTLQYLESEGKLRVASFSDLVVMDSYTPGLSASDKATIVDVLNKLIDVSGLSLTSPGGDLTEVNVVDEGAGAVLKATFSAGGSSYKSESQLQEKLDGMTTSLETAANDYLADGEGQWTVDVTVVADISLDIVVQATALGVTSTADASIIFDGLTATITDGTIAVGSKTATFSIEGEIGCDAGVPSVTLTTLEVGDEHPGFQAFIADNATPLMEVGSQALDVVIENTALVWPACPISIEVVGSDVVLVTAGLVEGDANLDGVTDIVDAMFIAQYTVQLRELTADQLTAGDTTDDGVTNITDAMHIAQFTVDPTGIGGVLYKPLWESPADDLMIDPLTL